MGIRKKGIILLLHFLHISQNREELRYETFYLLVHEFYGNFERLGSRGGGTKSAKKNIKQNEKTIKNEIR